MLTRLMRKALFILNPALLIVLALFASWFASGLNIATAQQIADPSFEPSVAHPAYTAESPKVLFDEAHLNFHTTEGRYKPFFDLITNDGYQVVSNRQMFQPETLADYNILVVANAQGEQDGQSAFSESECDAVRKWVKAGGSLLLIADHAPHGAAAASLANRFGVEMSNSFTVDLSHYDEETGNPGFLVFTRQSGLLTEHAILKGRNRVERVNRIMTFTGQSLLGAPESEAFLRLSNTALDLQQRLRRAQDLLPGAGKSATNRAQGVALQFGQGRVVVLGEAAMLSAQLIQTPSQGTFPIGMNRPGLDNRQLALNIMHWLSRLLN